jgi:hypothetical protein
MENVLHNYSYEEGLELLIEKYNELYNSKQGQNILDELWIAKNFNLTYTDQQGFDGIDEQTKEQVEFKTCNSRTAGRAQWNGCGDNKSKADYFILWDKITEQYAKVPTFLIHQNVQSGQIKARLSDNPGGYSETMLTTSSWFK